MLGVSASHWFLWNQFIDAPSHGRLDRPLIVSGQTTNEGTAHQRRFLVFFATTAPTAKKGTPRFCPSFPPSECARFRAAAHTRTFPEPSGLMIRFVFPKCRSSGRSEHCQGGGSGRRGHYLDKRSGAIHSPAANTKPLRHCERFARQRIFTATALALRLMASAWWPCANTCRCQVRERPGATTP